MTTVILLSDSNGEGTKHKVIWGEGWTWGEENIWRWEEGGSEGEARGIVVRQVVESFLSILRPTGLD